MAQITIRPIVGQKIVGMRKMTQKEKDDRGWYRQNTVVVLKLEDGVEIYPQRDEEGNDGGCLVGMLKDGQEFYVSDMV